MILRLNYVRRLKNLRMSLRMRSCHRSNHQRKRRRNLKSMNYARRKNRCCTMSVIRTIQNCRRKTPFSKELNILKSCPGLKSCPKALRGNRKKSFFFQFLLLMNRCLNYCSGMKVSLQCFHRYKAWLCFPE
jgi:hypothetical protein